MSVFNANASSAISAGIVSTAVAVPGGLLAALVSGVGGGVLCWIGNTLKDYFVGRSQARATQAREAYVPEVTLEDIGAVRQARRVLVKVGDILEEVDRICGNVSYHINMSRMRLAAELGGGAQPPPEIVDTNIWHQECRDLIEKARANMRGADLDLTRFEARALLAE